ncbi:hypothetical protein D9M71_516070 [compost metagenome]
MNVSGSYGSRSVLIDTDQKTVHKSNVDNLARSIKTVLQSSSNIFSKLDDQKLSPMQKVQVIGASNENRSMLANKLEEIKVWKKELGRSSYNHASFKGETLDKLAKKIDLNIGRLKEAKASCVEKDPFLAKLQEVKSEGEVEGFKLDQNAQREFGRIFDKR